MGLQARANAFILRFSESIERFFLLSRYMLVPLYGLMMFGILSLVVDCGKMLWGLDEGRELTEHVVRFLELLDTTMVANLIWLVNAGNYFVYVDNTYPNNPKNNRPRALVHISAGILKEKMAASLIGVESVYLLQLFLDAYQKSTPIAMNRVMVMLAIFFASIVAMLAFSYINEADHHNHKEEEEKHANATEPAH